MANNVSRGGATAEMAADDSSFAQHVEELAGMVVDEAGFQQLSPYQPAGAVSIAKESRNGVQGRKLRR